MAEDILGISAHLDINDLIKGFEQIIDKLDELGAITTEAGWKLKTAFQGVSDALASGDTISVVNSLGDAFEQVKSKVVETLQAVSSGKSDLGFEQVAAMVTEYKNLAVEAVNATQQAYAAEVENVSRLERELSLLLDKSHQMAEAGDTKGFEAMGKALEDTATQLAQARERTQGLKDKLAEAQSEAQNAQTAFSGLGEAAQTIARAEAADAFNGMRESLIGFAERAGGAIDKTLSLDENLKGMQEAFSLLPEPIQKTVTGIGAMTKASLKFIATPLGMILTAIALALRAVFTWFNKSAAGQLAFAKVSAYVGSILESLTDVIVKVGEYLFHAFTDADGALHGFATSLVKTLSSAAKAAYHTISGLVGAVKAIKNYLTDLNYSSDQAMSDLSAAWGELTKGGSAFVDTWKNMADTIKNSWTGWGKIGSDLWDKTSLEGIKDWFSQSATSAEIAMNLAGEQFKIEQQIGDVKEEQAALMGDIEAKQEEINKLTGEAKKEEIAKLRTMQADYYDKEIAVRRKALEMTQAQNKLHSVTIEALDQEQAQRTAILKLEQQKAAAMRRNTQMSERADKQMASQAAKEARAAKAEERRERNAANAISNAEDKYYETVYKNVSERTESELELDNKLAEARIKAMKNGAEKIRAERELEHKKELQQIAKEMREAVDAERSRQRAEFEAQQAIVKAQGGTIRKWEEKTDLDTSPIDAIKAKYEELGKLAIQLQEQTDYDELIGKYKDYSTQRSEIEEEYYAKISDLEKLRKEAEQKGDKQRVDALTFALAKARAEMGQKLVDLSVNQIKQDPTFLTAYEDLATASADTLKNLAREYKNAKQAAEDAGQPTSAYRKEIEKIQNILDRQAPFVAVREAVADLQAAEPRLKAAEDRLKAIQDGYMVVKSIGEDGKPVFWTEDEAKQDVADKFGDYEAALRRAERAVQDSIRVTEALQKSMINLGNAIGGTAGEIASLIGGLMGYATNGINAVMDAAKAAEAASQAGDKMGAAFGRASMWMAAITTMVQAIKSVQEILPTTDELYERAAEKQAEINNLTRAVYDYRLAVVRAQSAERNWFASTGLSSLTNAYREHGEIVKAYYAELMSAQEKYVDKAAGIKKVLPYLAAAASIVIAVASYGAGSGFSAAILGSTLAGSIAATAGTAAASAIAAAAVGTAAGVAAAGIQAGVDSIRYNDNQVAARDNLRVQTRHKTWFRGEKTEDLRSYVKRELGEDLFDQNGLINVEAAEVALEKYKLVGETRETLERLVELRKEYDEFMKEVENYVADLYSPLVDNMTDALFEWLATGRDVLSQFKSAAQQTFADVAKDMIRQMVINQIFDKYKEQLKDIYATYAVLSSDSTKAKIANDYLISGVMEATDSFMKTAEQQIPVLQEAIQQIDEQFKERGWDISGTNFGSESASYKSASGFTYDQANEMNGRLAALQIGVEMGNAQRMQMLEAFEPITFNLSELTVNAGRISDNMEQIVVMQFDSLSRLTEIRDNTAVLPEMATNIQEMRDDIRNKL